MAIGVTFFIIAILTVSIWVIIEFKRLKHKLLAMFLIGLILFTYLSFTASIKGKEVDIKTIPGIIEAGKLYLAWMGGLFSNMKSITAYALKQDWKKTDENIENKEINISSSILDKL
jgi:hypothetical protein